MTNLRLISVVVVDSTTITATFSEVLNENIGTSNIVLSAQTPGVPTPLVLAVSIVGNAITATTQPLTPLAAYFITFISTSTQLFNSLNGDAVILNDGITNVQLILGPLDPENPIQTYLLNYLNDGVYNIEPPSIIYQYIQGLSTILSEALYGIKQAGNENYLSFTVTDELQTRGAGAFDRLDNESAYEVLRVGINPTGANLSSITNVSSFPSYPISLESTNNAEILTTNLVDKAGSINLNTLVLNLSEQLVIQLNSVIFTYNNTSTYVYNIAKYGYQILNSEYDPDFAFTYLQLSNNQIRLSENILNDPNFSLENIASVQANYQYKNTGKIIDQTSLVVDSVLPSGREVVPPLENIFTLQHAPIVTSNDVLGTVGDITFIDPNALPGSGTPHPAFIYEVTFSFGYLPSLPGQYSVDYSTGNVYVFGATTSQDGTGAYPPLAVYNYRRVYVSEVDYVYDVDSLDLVALPFGNLLNSDANIIYNYEQVLSQGIDYVADVHIEALNENIQNRLTALNSIQPLNFPVTDVFRIFNQTTGEIYSVLRFTDSAIYFNYVKPPNIVTETGETVSFKSSLNELLFVNVTIPNGSTSIFKIFLSNNNVMAKTQDCIGSSINTSVYFSDTTVFIQERYFDPAISQAVNNSRLQNIGDYQIDYTNGVVYCLVPLIQNVAIGTISYRYGYIDPDFSQVITVDNIYYRFSPLSQIVKTFGYTRFSSDSILPASFDISNESFFMGNFIDPYIIVGGQVGYESTNATFIPGVTSRVNFVRGLYEYDDVVFNTSPINFASATTSGGMNINVDTLQFVENHTVQFDGANYYFFANTNLLYHDPSNPSFVVSPNITMTQSIVRVSDGKILTGNIVSGSPFKVVLTGSNSPQVGDPVKFTYTYTINDGERIVVDYNRGNYLVDYSYLADVIIISYEYGDNVLDFRQSSALSPGDTYYVTYRVGALRDALLANFGTLINIPILNTLDVDFVRERYRDALMAAMQSFTTGPTLKSMSNLVETIVHTKPQIIESAFTNWSLGTNLLNPETIATTGALTLSAAKYGNGVTLNEPGQTVKFPVVSNLRLEQGALETWVLPEWNGIDNESELTFCITKNGIPLLPENIFIGPAAYHPVFDGYCFSISTQNKVLGIPNQSKDGVFIYYTADANGNFNRWYLDVLDGYADGYEIKNYTINITTNGKFYDVKSTLNPQPASDNIFSGTNKLTYTISGLTNIDGYYDGYYNDGYTNGITFVADNHHYLFDFGKSESSNRFSLYKDESGYINFRVIDCKGNVYAVSSDVSSWRAGQLHFVAAAWALGTKNGRDEMHLFIDGFEVPNIIVYKSKVSPYLHEKFRTVNPEEIVGLIPAVIVSDNDLIATFGSDVVSSLVDFTAAGVMPGGIIVVNEPGFNPAGYTILVVSGQSLTLSSPMPASGTGLSYTVNPTTLPVKTEINLYSNIAVSLLHAMGVVFIADLQTMNGNPVVTATSTNFTVLGVQPGYTIVINEPGFAPSYTILAVNGNSLTLNDDTFPTFTNATYNIYDGTAQEIPGQRAIIPAYSISVDNFDNVLLTITNYAQPNDIVLIETLGLNLKYIDQKYYLWNGLPNDGYPYINNIMTRLPSPALLADVKVTHILLDGYLVGPSDAVLIGGVFVCDGIQTDQPSFSDNGRTLNVWVRGTNVDYTVPATVTINGTIGGVPNQSVTLSFSQNAVISTAPYKFESVNYVNVSCKPINPALNCIVLSIEETYPITIAENSNTVPVIRYSYQMFVGNTLSGTGGDTVTDLNGFFSVETIGNYLVISSPAYVAGQYQIIGVNDNGHTSATINASLLPFTNAVYQILDVSTYRSGLQSGFFTFELADGYVGSPYNLVQGLYKFEYYTYLSIPINAGTLYGYVGSDMFGNNQFDGTINQFQTISEKITDTRVGETVATNQESITKDFNSLKALKPTVSSLMFLTFNTLPFINSANIYTSADNNYIQSAYAVNSNFGKSVRITNSPIVIDNTGILHPKLQGTIEFWISPLYDTGNDPNYRYYFDATAIMSQQVVSTNNATVTVSGDVSKVLSVKVQIGNQNIDYFAGGRIDPNMKTLYLNRALPSQNTPVVVNYIPVGTNGDRISIYKDPVGYINFNVIASGQTYQIRSPAFWSKDTWHRVKAQYIFNTGAGSDAIKLFVDGYERGNVLVGNGLLVGQGQVFGSWFVGPNNIHKGIVFKDTVNEFFIGSDFTGCNGAYALFDNLRISDIFRPLFMPFGEAIDVNYSSNTAIVFPVVTDLYTTLLLDFDSLVTLQTNFATLKNPVTGLFNFRINIFDSFGIVSGSAVVKQVLEELISTLKPANTQSFVNYIE